MTAHGSADIGRGGAPKSAVSPTGGVDVTDELRLPAVGRALCLGGAAVGALGLLATVAKLRFLGTLIPGQPEIRPNTAVSLILIGCAAASCHRDHKRGTWRVLSVVAAIAVLMIGVATIAEYVTGTGVGELDQLLLQSLSGPYPGRPSPAAAWALTCLAGAVLLFDARSSAHARPLDWLAVCAGLIASIALLGQLFGAGPLYRLSLAPVIVGISVPTALSVILTSVGLVLQRPHAGLVRLATSPGPGGVLLRRLAVPAALAPVALGLIVTRVLDVSGFHDLPFVFGTLMFVTSLVTLSLLSMTAVPLNEMHDALELNRERTRDLVEHASDGIFVGDLEGRCTDVNSAACNLLGFTRDQIVGSKIVDLLAPKEIERFQREHERLAKGDTHVAEWSLRCRDGGFLPVEMNARILPDGRWQGIVRDIRERKLAEERTRESQERLALALKGADLGAWDWNIETGHVFFNRRYTEMRGYRPDEIRPHIDSWLASLHPDDRATVVKALTDCLQGVVPEYEAEHRISTKSGEWIWVLDRGRVLARDDGGYPTRMAGTELDVTSRTRAAEALRLSEAKFSGIVSVSADAIISIDEDQRITLFNEGAERIFGYSKAEAIGASIDILIPARFRLVHRRHVEGFAAGHDAARPMGQRGADIVGLRKGGTEFFADAAISKLDVAGKRILIAAIRDVTEQKRIEGEQRFLAEVGAVFAGTLEYEDTLATIARLLVRDLADLCVVELVGEGRERSRLEIACRDPAKAWIADVLERTPLVPERPYLLQGVIESKRPRLVPEARPEHFTGWEQNQEYVHALRDLDPHSLLVVPLLAHEKLLGAIALVSTSSVRAYGAADLRFAEEIAQRAALSLENAGLYRAAQRATRARDDVLGIVAHDLRNPLGTILTQAELLRRRGPEPDRRSRKPAETIERAATRMSHLIKDLLDVTALEAGALSVARAPISAAQAVVDAVTAQSPLAVAASMDLRTDLSPGMPEVLADRDRLLQVFENLIGNAVNFAERGGRVTVGAAPRGDDEVLFWVADTGVGISPEDKPHLFDRFWQGRRVGRRGVGLGLAIVRGIVEAHGGRVWVDSTPGTGSTFFFTIPTAPRTAEWRAEPAPHGP